jgi:phospholipid N-methyltransferase
MVRQAHHNMLMNCFANTTSSLQFQIMNLKERIEEYWLFASEGAKDIVLSQSICALFPMSWKTVKALSMYVRNDVRNVIELGTGTGRLPRQLTINKPRFPGHIGMLPSSGRYLGIELNPRFAEYASRVNSDPRVDIVNGSAMDLHPIQQKNWGGMKTDIVFASLPFSRMGKMRDEIFHAVREALVPGGKFVVSIYCNIEHELSKTFDVVAKSHVLRGIHPMRIHEASTVLPNSNSDTLHLNGFSSNGTSHTKR